MSADVYCPLCQKSAIPLVSIPHGAVQHLILCGACGEPLIETPEDYGSSVRAATGADTGLLSQAVLILLRTLRNKVLSDVATGAH